MALIVAGYVTSALFLGGSALSYHWAVKRGAVAKQLTTQPVRSVESAFEEAKKAGDDGVYLNVDANSAPTDEKDLIKARFSGEKAIITQTEIVHEYEDREVTHSQTQLFGGTAAISSSFGSWHKRFKTVDTQLVGKTLYLDDNNPQHKARVRIPADSVDLSGLLVEVAAPLHPTPQTQTSAGEPQPTPSTVVNVVNSSTESFRTIGYRHHERIIRAGRPVVGLAEYYLADPRDIRQSGGDVTGITQPYLSLRVPRDSSRPFVLSGKTRPQLIHESEDDASSLKMSSAVCLGLGLTLLGVTGYAHSKRS